MNLVTRVQTLLVALVAVFVANGGDGWPWN